jgi:hypothetical protein
VWKSAYPRPSIAPKSPSIPPYPAQADGLCAVLRRVECAEYANMEVFGVADDSGRSIVNRCLGSVGSGVVQPRGESIARPKQDGCLYGTRNPQTTILGFRDQHLSVNLQRGGRGGHDVVDSGSYLGSLGGGGDNFSPLSTTRPLIDKPSKKNSPTRPPQVMASAWPRRIAPMTMDNVTSKESNHPSSHLLRGLQSSSYTQSERTVASSHLQHIAQFAASLPA